MKLRQLFGAFVLLGTLTAILIPTAVVIGGQVFAEVLFLGILGAAGICGGAYLLFKP